VREPAVFLFDEPLTSLDAGLRLVMRSEIKALHQRLGATMLYVTHDQSEAMALGDRICVLREGRMQQVGCPADIYDRPVSQFVAGFFGSPPMNFLAACVPRDEHGGAVDVAAGTITLPVSLQSCLRGYEKKNVIIGIRPHDLSLDPVPGQRGNALAGQVDLIEPLGSRTDAHVKLASGEDCVVSCPPSRRLQTGSEVQLYIDVDKIHLFDPDDAGPRLVAIAAPEG
jgi:multiple sugar transport system ATP-binding protein